MPAALCDVSRIGTSLPVVWTITAAPPGTTPYHISNCFLEADFSLTYHELYSHRGNPFPINRVYKHPGFHESGTLYAP